MTSASPRVGVVGTSLTFFAAKILTTDIDGEALFLAFLPVSLLVNYRVRIHIRRLGKNA
jgi:hypothetical protein